MNKIRSLLSEVNQAITYDTSDLIDLVVKSVASPHSKRMYRTALREFFAWNSQGGRFGITRDAVIQYKQDLSDRSLAPATINQRLCAIRKLVLDAAGRDLLAWEDANAIARISGVRMAGRRTGVWLTKTQAQALLDLPDLSTLKGFRDRAILAVILGGGLRRSEVAALQFTHFRNLEGRWVIADLIGKGNRTRTVPVGSWVKLALDEWSRVSGIQSGFVFRQLKKGDTLASGLNSARISTQAVYRTVNEYAIRLGITLSSHDLRRTFSRLALKGGADIKQIQYSLGHSSVQTTERYLGMEQDLQDAPGDRVGLRLG